MENALFGGESFEVEVVSTGTDKKGTRASAAANLANSTIGAGLLALPIVLKYAGVIPGVLCILIMGGMADFSLNLLTQLASTLPPGRQTYEDLGGILLGGRAGTKLVEISTLGINFGAITAYVIILGDMIVPVVRWVADVDDGENPFWASRVFLTLLAATSCMLPLSLLRRITSLRFASMLSLTMVVVFVVVVLFDASTKSPSSHLEGRHEDISWFRLSSDIFKGIPLITFAFACHTNLYPVLAEMPSLTGFSAAIHASTTTCAVLYILTAVAGYVSFLSETKGDLLVGYPDDSVLFNLVRMLFCVTMVLTYPLAGYPVRVALDRMLFPSASRELTRARLVGETVGYWLASVALALAIPKVTVVFGLIGATASSFTSYIIPGAAYLRSPHITHSLSKRVGAWALIVLGVVLGTTSTIVILIGAFSDEEDE